MQNRNKLPIAIAVLFIAGFCTAPLWMYSALLLILFGAVDVITLAVPFSLTVLIGVYTYSFVKKDYARCYKTALGSLFALMIGIANIEQMIAGFDYIMGGVYTIIILLILLFKNRNDVRYFLIPFVMLLVYVFRYYWLL